MNAIKHQRRAGVLLIVEAVLINISYTMLSMSFDYPDILREPTGAILTRYQEGGRWLLPGHALQSRAAG